MSLSAPQQRKSRSILVLMLALLTVGAGTFHVTTTGSNSTGDGSAGAPWATIEHAVGQVPDGSLILVGPGTYSGQVHLSRSFDQGIVIRSQTPYRARLRNTSQVIVCFYGQGITIEGFDIAHSGPGASPLVIQIQDLIDGPERTSRIMLRNNVLHDSYNNDILKINNGADRITVTGNVFYNQTGSDEHIDINSVSNVVVEDNIFFNDFAGSGRTNNNDTSSFIVIKDSNGNDDGIEGTGNVIVRRNVFLNWEGSSGSSFVLAGEDGNAYYEAMNVLIESNLMLGNAANVMRAPVGVKGCRDIEVRGNTVVGDLPALAFAMRLNREGSNLVNDNIFFYNNIWSDPTGTMGANGGGANDFSDTPPADTDTWQLERNLYSNGGTAIPEDAAELINYTDDTTRVIGDPVLAAQTAVVVPRWVLASNSFADGSLSIAEAHRRLVLEYGTPGTGSAAIDHADPAHAPADDILGQPRSLGGVPDIGAYETGVDMLFGDGFEHGDTWRWSAAITDAD